MKKIILKILIYSIVSVIILSYVFRIMDIINNTKISTVREENSTPESHLEYKILTDSNLKDVLIRLTNDALFVGFAIGCCFIRVNLIIHEFSTKRRKKNPQ